LSILAGLNSQQAEAVKAPFGRNCLILAGAGCGKTTVLTRRIAHCAATFCAQDRILALTFTHKAAEEMRTRVSDIESIRRDAPLPRITTFHGFGLGVLRDTVHGERNAKRLGFSSEPQLLDSRKRLEMLAAISTPQERHGLGADLLKIDNLLACCEADSGKLINLDAQRRAVLDSLARRFEKKKIEQNVWEFSDMLTQVLNLFGGFPEIQEHYARFFGHIVVDEFQDTSPLQIRLLDSLLSAGASLFAVGDDDQAIYAFRGADTGPTLDFPTRFNNASVLKLETNYRSRPAILNAANRIFADKPPAYRKVLKSGRYSMARDQRGQKPRRNKFESQEDMVGWIIQQAGLINRKHGIPITGMCLLFRLNETLEWARAAFVRRGIGMDGFLKMMTVHGSKGLEFPVVFLCDLEESQFPNYRQRKDLQVRTWMDLFRRLFRRGGSEIDCDLDEEKRLFYVGVTRAVHFLFLLSCREKMHNGRTIKLVPSRFLKGMAG
jgi:superfamily I DNA/RNA helicase